MRDDGYIPPGRLFDWYARTFTGCLLQVVFLMCLIGFLYWAVTLIVHAAEGSPPPYAGLSQAQAVRDARHAMNVRFRAPFVQPGYGEVFRHARSGTSAGRSAWDVQLFTAREIFRGWIFRPVKPTAATRSTYGASTAGCKRRSAPQTTARNRPDPAGYGSRVRNRSANRPPQHDPRV
jgi:hypothetical protein